MNCVFLVKMFKCFYCLFLIAILWKTVFLETSFNNKQSHLDNPAVKKLQEYIRIDTSKSENYDLMVKFWKEMALFAGLPLAVYRPAGWPVLVMTWEGRRPELPSILVNTHSDVVSADGNSWKYPPFEAFIDDKGDLYGRGTQDTKSLSIQHFEAIRKLKQSNITLDRTIHMSILPGEESGGFRGVKEFVKTDFFRKLNVGFALDEGLTTPNDTFFAVYQDRRPWQINMTIYGSGGHGSLIRKRTVVEKLYDLLTYVKAFQEQQKQIMINRDPLDYGAYTTANVNIIKTGFAVNAIPNVMNVVIDMRLATDANITDMDNMLSSWREVTGPGTRVEFLRRDEVSPATATDQTNPFWLAMQDAAQELNIKIRPVVCPATSDMLVLRKLGIPAIGFAPNTNMKVRMHDTDEYMPIDTFLRGIDIITTLIRKLGNV